MLINPYFNRPPIYPEDGLMNESSYFLRNEYGTFLEYDPLIDPEDAIQTEDDYILTSEDLAPIQFDELPVVFDLWDPSNKSSSIVLSQSNARASGSDHMSVRSVSGHSTGIRQFEVTINQLTDTILIGMGRVGAPFNDGPGDVTDSFGLAKDGKIHVIGSVQSVYASITLAVNDVIGAVYNFSTGFVTFYRNGVSLGNYEVGYQGIELFAMVGSQGSSGPWAATLSVANLQYPVVGATQWNDA